MVRIKYYSSISFWSTIDQNLAVFKQSFYRYKYHLLSYLVVLKSTYNFSYLSYIFQNNTWNNDSAGGILCFWWTVV